MASATSGMMDEFNEEYGTNGTRLDTCDTCHGSDIESLNPYGMDYQENDGDLGAIESLDSDGDGYSNEEEINVLTFPGDQEDNPETRSSSQPDTTVPSEPDDITEEAPVEDTGTEQQSPGFEAIFAVAGILMAIYIIKRK
ncbi:PGF-CTERM sorting domain-containing protein [Methanolobus halotolerans]|uniref:PGF-CTERM archaeal protein-sorting signal domain-containing protein n=1 Tax=Methanolobus halotolerans TaxID=2052935 RepID=A0A4E0PZ73_9EURY|nr:PGF-CTERM sorting domain-containing protein [Methanolobus halotolerans]TGC09150.1 hypothetical protein CUN85_07210 [Methanolobus halotolerans]